MTRVTGKPLGATLVSVALLAIVARHAHAADSYNVQTGQLHIPAVAIGAATLTNVVVGVTPADIVVAPFGTVPFGTVDNYNPVNDELIIQSVDVSGTLYDNLVVRLGALVSIGAITGADTYNASTGLVTIPQVQVGNLIYTDVVATIKSVQGVGGGLPKKAIDLYTPATHQLTVAAVQSGSRIYTNAVVTPGTIKSVGGQLPVESTVYSFAAPGGTDSNFPEGTLMLGADGNLYGTAAQGGAHSLGTVFRVTPSGVETILHSFGPAAAVDGGWSPEGGLVQGGDGTLYGTTAFGGTTGNGTVFRITPQGTESLVYSFAGGSDGALPLASLALDGAGNLYGTTASGGANGSGTVFKVTPQGHETVLWSFAGNPDGASPWSSLTLGKDGNFYGTTQLGGTVNGGTAFRITPAGSLTILHSFGATAGDGVAPDAGLTLGPDGNFYGTTTGGGAFISNPHSGTVFRMTPGGAVSVLHSFSGAPTATGQTDGANPVAGLLVDANGNLYGTTHDGGRYGGGILFKVTSAGKETILYHNAAIGTVADSTDGNFPTGLVLAADGSVYGAAAAGGANNTGVVFRLTGALTAY